MRMRRPMSRSGDDYNNAERLASIVNLVAGARGERSGHGIYYPVLVVGVVGIGAVYAFAVGTSVF
jgi:hypothetical protein